MLCSAAALSLLPTYLLQQCESERKGQNEVARGHKMPFIPLILPLLCVATLGTYSPTTALITAVKEPTPRLQHPLICTVVRGLYHGFFS